MHLSLDWTAAGSEARASVHGAATSLLHKWMREVGTFRLPRFTKTGARGAGVEEGRGAIRVELSFPRRRERPAASARTPREGVRRVLRRGLLAVVDGGFWCRDAARLGKVARSSGSACDGAVIAGRPCC